MEMAQQDIKNLWDEVTKIKDNIDNMLYPSMDDFNALKGRVEKLENAVAALKKAYGDLDKAMAKLRMPQDTGANQEQVDKLMDELSRLRTEFEQHRDHAN